METRVENVAIDQEKVHSVLADFTLPTQIERIEIAFGADWAGDPSVSLTFHVKDEAKVGPEELQHLTEFLSKVTTALLEANIAAFPYTRLEQAA